MQHIKTGVLEHRHGKLNMETAAPQRLNAFYDEQMQSLWGRFLVAAVVITMTAILWFGNGAAHTVYAQEQQQKLPNTSAVALDGHSVSLPRDLSPATVVIVGFSKASAGATTAWEIPVRTKLAGGSIGLYDVAVLGGVPGFLHGWIVRSLRSKVPPVLQGRFLPVFADEAAWKQACGYDPKAPDAAYVLVTDKSGDVLWKTRKAYSPQLFEQLRTRTLSTTDASASKLR